MLLTEVLRAIVWLVVVGGFIAAFVHHRITKHPKPKREPGPDAPYRVVATLAVRCDVDPLGTLFNSLNHVAYDGPWNPRDVHIQLKRVYDENDFPKSPLITKGI